MMHSFNRAPRCLHVLMLLLVAAVSLFLPGHAKAATCQSTSATLSFPGSVTVPSNLAVGQSLGVTGTATITFTCSGLPVSSSPADYTATIQAGQYLATLDPTNNPAGPGITFATSLSGIAVLVKATPVQATSQACLACGPTSTAGYVPGSVTAPSNAKKGSYSGTVVANYTAQLIKTGPITPGTITSNQLIPFWWYIAGGSQNSTSASLSTYLILPTITVSAPACTVSSASKNISVTLPSVQASSLASSGQTAAATPFNIALTGCPSGVKTVTAYFNSSANIDTNTGNLINNGSAANVEVQLLNGNGSTTASAFSPIVLTGAQATAQNSGQYAVNATGAATMNYYAQYIATGAAAAGSVNTSVTFTIAYP
jgi:type 1 fimbria pilin